MITKYETITTHSPNKRYILHETLGQGGMGVVYRATDRLNGEDVALKQVYLPPEQLDFMSLMSPSASMTTQNLRLALAQEFQTLATLRHPHIISVLDYGFGQDGQPYFTMNLLNQPQTILEAGQTLDVAGKIELISQMLQALAYLHRRGILHRDLKPSNVFVSEDGRVRVLDFGLSAAKEEAQSSSGGTFAYMAPELLLGQSASSEASDLYAVGIIAYELLVGRHPFEQNSEHFLDQVLNQAPDLSALEAPLAEVIAFLLKKTPQERYQSAEACLAALSQAIGQPAPAESIAIRESYLQAATFVGREDEMATLTKALQEAQAGHGEAWLIGGESGVGKSRLIDELRIQALVQGFLVWRGQAVSDGGSLFQLWQPILRALLLSEAVEDAVLSILKPLLPDIESLLERPIPDAPPLGGQAGQQRLLTTIATLFEQQNRPILLLLEDLHWAGDRLLILKHLNQIVGQLPLIIIATYRDDEAPHLSQQLPAMQSLKLARLSERESATLTASMLGELGQQASFLAFLQKETEGNTFFLVEVLRALAEEAGGLTNIDPQALPTDLFPQGIQSIMQQRLARVPGEAVRMLEFAAVIGRQVEINLLAELLPQANLEAWLQRCAEAAVFEVHEGAWRFAHDKVREAVLGDLTPQQAQKDHRLVAQTIETLHPEQPAHFGRLVYHWHVAQDQQKEQHYANLAGRHARRQYAYHEAKSYLTRALSLTPADEFETRYNLLIERQDVHLILGHAQAREQDLIALKDLTDGLVDHPNFEPKEVAEWRADTALHRAHHFQARNVTLAQAIAEEGLSVIQQTNSTYLEITLGLQLAYAYMNQALYPSAQAQIETTLHLVRTREDANPVFEGFSLYYLGLLYLERGELRLAKEAVEQAWQILQEHNAKVTYPVTLAVLAKIEQASEKDEEAKAHFEQALSLAREIYHQEYEAEALSALGKMAWQRGAYDESEQLLRQALSMSKETENKRLLITVLLRLGYLLSSRGDNEQANPFFSLALKESQVLKWPSLVSEALTGMSHLAHRQGQLEEALTYSRQALAITQKFGMRLLQLDVLMGLGEVLRDYGESQEALKHYTDALTLCQALGKARQAQVVQAAIRKLTQALSPKRAAAQPEAPEKITGKITMPDLETLLTDTLAQAIQQVGAERGVIVLRQKDGKERITKSAQYGEDPISRTIINKVIQSNTGIVIRNAMTDRHFARAKSIMQGRIRSVLCVPLRENQHAIGAIYLEHRSKRGKFGQQHLAAVEGLAQQMAEAMSKR